MNSNKPLLIDSLIEIGRRMGCKNYTPGYSGNISARFGENILITVSGSSNGYLSANDFVEMDYNGNSLESGKKPSSEKLLHVEFYKKRPDIDYILHVHPSALSAFASAGKDLMSPIMAENVFYFGGIPLAEYALPSSVKLVENTSKYFDEYDAVLMANHGFIIGSSTLEDAYQKLEIAEEYARTVIYTQTLGGARPLSNRDAQEVLNLRANKS